MPSTPKGLSDEKAAGVLVAFREGRTLRQFAMRAGRFDAYCKAHPEYAREALPLLEETETGLLVTIRGSKADQERQGVTIAIARGDIACPVKALREWLDAAGIEAGPIFRPIDKAGTVRGSRLTDRSVANIIKAYAGRAGFDASTFSGHSLRSGFLTSAAGKGASIFKMMDVSRHKSMDTLRGYVRDAELFKDHAGAGLL